MARLDGAGEMYIQPERGRRELKRLWVEGNIDALASLGLMEYYGKGVAENEEVGLEKLRRAARDESKLALEWLAKKNIAPGDNKDAQLPADIPSPSIKEQLETAFDELEDWNYRLSEPPSTNSIELVLNAVKNSQAGVYTAKAFYFVGICGARGWRDVPEWRDYLKKAVEMDDANAMATWGYRLATGFQADKDVKAGVALIKRSAACGNLDGLYALGIIYKLAVGPGFEVDLEKSREFLLKAKESGMLRAVAALHDLALQEGRAAEAAAYAQEGIRLCDDSRLWAGAKAEMGDLNHRDASRAMPYVKRGALCGAPSLTSTLATWIASDPAEASLSRRLLIAASSSGDSTAEAVLAAAHITGEYGVQIDLERGLWTLKKLAINEGNTDACWHLGRILYDGINLPRNRSAGEVLIRRAASQGSEFAQQRISTMP